MRIFQQAAFRRLEDGGDDEEEGPGAHLSFGLESPDEDHQVDKAEEGNGKTL
jgi:hypothetical protein